MNLETGLKLLIGAALTGNLEQAIELEKRFPGLATATDDDQRSALHYAAIEGRADMVNILLAIGADANQRDRWGKSPLLVSVYEEILVSDRIPTVVALMAGGADVDLPDYSGNTPLHMAALCDELEVAKLLVLKGADRLARNNAGQSPLDVAKEQPASCVAAFLQGG